MSAIIIIPKWSIPAMCGMGFVDASDGIAHFTQCANREMLKRLRDAATPPTPQDSTNG